MPKAWERGAWYEFTDGILTDHYGNHPEPMPEMTVAEQLARARMQTVYRREWREQHSA
jgi:hypothetical protein